MINCKYSDDVYSVFESITYKCDKCKKKHTVMNMDDYNSLFEEFDFENPDESILLCWDCSNNKPDNSKFNLSNEML